MKPFLICMVIGIFFVSLPLNLMAAEWGSTVDGLRMSAEIGKNEFGNYELRWTIENTSQVNERFLVLGMIGAAYAELIKVMIISPDGSKHWAWYAGSKRGGIAPGRTLPIIVPLLPKSTYSAATLLGGWAYNSPNLQRVESLLSQPASLQLLLEVGMDPAKPTVKTDCSLDCFGDQIFWRGRLTSNIIKLQSIRVP